jgi:hypothetical protein
MANVHRQKICFEDHGGGGDQVVRVVDSGVGTSVLPGEGPSGAGDLFVDRDPGESREELFEDFYLLVSHTGQELESNDFARDHRLIFLDDPAEEIDGRLGAPQMIDGDACVQQFQ